MTTIAELLDAVAAAPEDSVLRLVVADHYEERGECDTAALWRDAVAVTVEPSGNLRLHGPWRPKERPWQSRLNPSPPASDVSARRRA